MADFEREIKHITAEGTSLQDALDNFDDKAIELLNFRNIDPSRTKPLFAVRVDCDGSTYMVSQQWEVFVR